MIPPSRGLLCQLHRMEIATDAHRVQTNFRDSNKFTETKATDTETQPRRKFGWLLTGKRDSINLLHLVGTYLTSLGPAFQSDCRHSRSLLQRYPKWDQQRRSCICTCVTLWSRYESLQLTVKADIKPKGGVEETESPHSVDSKCCTPKAWCMVRTLTVLTAAGV